MDRTDKGKGEGAIYLLNFDGSPTALLSLVDHSPGGWVRNILTDV